MNTIKQPQVQSTNPAFGWNPLSRRFIKRTGTIYKRLVMSGVVVDPEVSAQLENPQTGTQPRVRAPNNVTLMGADGRELAEPGREECRRNARETALTRRTAKKLIAAHVDNLEGLPPEQVDDLLRRLLAMKMGGPQAAEKVAAPAVRVKVAATRKPPAGRKLRVADLFSSTEGVDTSEVPTSEYSD